MILGENGAGKTSLLEGIYLLSTTRSFRTSRIKECCQHGESSFLLQGDVDTDRRAQLSFSWSDGRRERLLSSRQASLAEHLGALPVVSWTSSDTEILVGSPGARRRFLDRGVLGLRPTAIEVFSRYRQTLQAKRQLLLAGGAELETWNEVLAEAAFDLIRLRHNYVDRLDRVLASIVEECSLDLGKIELRYRSSLKSGKEGSGAIFKELMAASTRERTLQQPLLGPHRDELVIRWGGHELKRVASAGERKAVGLLLLAAHGRILDERGSGCVYLLDDVDTELDQRRLMALWQVLARGRQQLITSNRPHVWQDIAIDYRWTCGRGEIQPAT